MRHISLVAALATVAVSPLNAQTWQSIGVPSNSNAGAYWNNMSADRVGSAVCNVAAILTNMPALTAADCDNETPVNLLPLSPAPLTINGFFLGSSVTAGNQPGAFKFAAGTYNISLIGRLAGVQTTGWGIITDAGVAFAGNQSNLTVSGPFAIWINQAIPAGPNTIFTSALTAGANLVGAPNTANQQFAVFTNSNSALLAGGVISANGVQTFYVGMEDNTNCGRGFAAAVRVCEEPLSDRDYNDLIVSVQAVPEPATIGLMGFGLLALAGIAKRRTA